MLSKLSGQIIALIVIGVSVLVAVVWYFTLYTNTLAESDGLRTEIATLNDQKQVGERARTNVVQLCQIVTDLQRQKAEFLQALPSNEQFSSLLDTLRNQARATQGEINSIARGVGAAAGSAVPAGVKAINVSMAFQGTLDSIRGLLGSLEQQQRFLRVETLSMAQAGTQLSPTGQPVAVSNPALSSQMVMTAYVYDNPNRDAAAAPINPVCADAGAGVPK
jgi:Tfp pilus assembly protein PilO